MVAGFIPTLIGEIYECAPTIVEVKATFGCWVIGALVLALLARFAMAFEAEVKIDCLL